MNKNEERKIYYFIPYKRNSRGYTRLSGAVGSCLNKSVSEFIQDLMVIPEYKSVEFFEVFYRSEDDWSNLKYFDTFRVVDFNDLTIIIEKNLFI